MENVNNHYLPTGILSDEAIKHYIQTGDINIFVDSEYEPLTSFDESKQIQPGSVDLRFRPQIRHHKIVRKSIPYECTDYTALEDVPLGEPLLIKPNESICITTLEQVVLTKNISGFVYGRSSHIRLQLSFESPYINPGHQGAIPLTITNNGKNTVELKQEEPICSLVFNKLDAPPAVGYAEKLDAKYANEKGPIDSALGQKEGAVAKYQTIPQKMLKTYDKLAPSTFAALVIVPTFLIVRENNQTVGDALSALGGAILSFSLYHIFIILFILSYILREGLSKQS